MTNAPEQIWAEYEIGGEYAPDQSSGRWYSSEFNGHKETEYIRADIAKPRVKPLVWEEPSQENNWIYVARSPWGDYGVHIDGGRHRAWLEAHEKPHERWLGDDDVGSVYEAKAAAQADYEARVLACLEAE